MIFKVSTTGAVSSTPLPDLGLRTLDHPTVSLDLGLEYSEDELLSSVDLTAAIDNGWLDIVEKSGGPVTEDYVDSAITTISGIIINQLSITESSTCQLRRTTDFTPSVVWQDIPFDTVDLETSPDVLEWDDFNADRILIHRDGLYAISYSFPARSSGATREVYARIIKNDTTELEGSYTNQDLYQDETHQQDRDFRVSLLAGDYLTLQIMVESTPVNIQGNQLITVTKLDGVRGDKGDPGEQGPQGIVTVSGSAYFDAYDSVGTLTLNTSWQDVPFNVVRKNSGEYTFNGDTELVLSTSTSYFIVARVTTDITSGTNRSDCRIRIVKDTGSGYVEMPGTRASTYNRLLGEGSTTAVSSLLDDFSTGDKIKVQVIQDSGADTINLLANGSSLTVFIPAGAEGPQGPPGVDGTDGTDGIDAGGTLACVQARRTTGISDIPLTWTDLTFDITDIEYDDTHLEHDDTNRDRFLVKQDGYYYMAVNLSVYDEVTVRMRKNDTTVLPGSTRPVGNTSDANDMVSAFQNACVAQLVAGDYVTVQIQSVTTAEQLFTDATFIMFALIGAKGEKGDPGIPGSGVEIIVRDEGTAVPNTPHQILNFAGAGVTATDNGSGEVNITIPGSSGVTIQDESSNITGTPHHTINFTGGPVSAYDLGSGVAGVWIQDPIFGSWYAWDGDEGETNTNSASPLEKASLSVTGVPAAYYRIGWYYEWRRNTTSNDYRAEIVIDGTTTIMEHSEESQDVNSWHTQSGYYIANLSSGNHTIRFYHYGEGTSNTSYTRRVRLEIWRVA